MPTENYAADYSEQNTVGLVGFIVSILGIFSAGVLSPIGMIISLVGLSKPPRGFATAGVIIGVVGTLMLFLWVLVIIVVSSAVAMVIALAWVVDTYGVMWFETGVDTYKIKEAVVAYEAENGTLPATVDQLTVEGGALTDYWGNPYIVDIIGTEGMIRVWSLGEDGVLETDDGEGIQDDHVIKMTLDFATKDSNWDEHSLLFGDQAKE